MALPLLVRLDLDRILENLAHARDYTEMPELIEWLKESRFVAQEDGWWLCEEISLDKLDPSEIIERRRASSSVTTDERSIHDAKQASAVPEIVSHSHGLMPSDQVGLVRSRERNNATGRATRTIAPRPLVRMLFDATTYVEL